MPAEFIDYKRSPAFWFYFGMLIASDISAFPILSAKVFPIDASKATDLEEVFEKGLRRYEKMERHYRERF